jgi:fatty-acyl-CoA synthase
VYHYRGAYLNAINNILDWSMPKFAVYLWTLPMFHCNGWCFNWTMAAAAGTNVCLRKVDPKLVLELIRDHRVTHYCGAPIVHSMLLNAPAEWKKGIEHEVALPRRRRAAARRGHRGHGEDGFDITHVYGLTETYGPAAVCAKQPEWSSLALEEQVKRNGRQGVATSSRRDGGDGSGSMTPVPWDGETMGEIMFRGNITMKGYLKNPKASEERSAAAGSIRATSR